MLTIHNRSYRYLWFMYDSGLKLMIEDIGNAAILQSMFAGGLVVVGQSWVSAEPVPFTGILRARCRSLPVAGYFYGLMPRPF